MFEAYSVGIRLRLLDSVSSGLMGLAGQFAALNKHVNVSQANLRELEGSMGWLKKLGMIGGAAAGIGFAGLYAFKAPFEEAKAWTQEAAKFGSLGFGAKINADAQQFALGMQTYGTSARENLTLLSDAMAVFKNLRDSEVAAPIMARMKFANEAVFGAESGGANERQFMNLLKVIELRRGLTSTSEFSTQANFAQQVITGSRGRVDPQAMLQLLKTGGVAVSQLGNSAFYLGLEPLVQEFGGQRTGTGLMSIYQNLVQGRGSLTAQRELMRLGLLDPHRVEFNAFGQLKKALPGAFVGTDIYESQGPLALLNQVLLPAFAAHGIKGQQQIIDEFGLLLSNRTASNIMTSTYMQRDRIAQNWQANAHAMNIDQLYATGQNTPEGKIIQLSAQWRNVPRELGVTVLPIAIKGVEGLTVVLKDVNSFAKTFPKLTAGLEVLTVGTLGLAAVGGTLAVVGTGLKGLGLVLGPAGAAGGVPVALMGVAKGIGAIGAAATTFAAAYGLGTWLNNKFHISEWIDNLLDPDFNKYNPNNYRHRVIGKIDRGSPFVNGGNPDVTVHTQINLDGRKIGDAVTKQQAKALSAPQTGISSFDGRLSPHPAGATGTW